MRPDRYSIQMTTCARNKFDQLPPDLRPRALREMLDVAGLAAQAGPPSPQRMQDACAEPPVATLTAWPLAIVYKSDPDRRTLTVLHVLCAHGAESHHQAAAFG